MEIPKVAPNVKVTMQDCVCSKFWEFMKIMVCAKLCLFRIQYLLCVRLLSQWEILWQTKI